MGVRGSRETATGVRVCVGEKGCRKKGGSTPSVRVPRRESPTVGSKGARAGSVHLRVGWSCCRGWGMTPVLCKLSGGAGSGKGTGASGLRECACELRQITGQEWGLWVHGRELL